MLLPSHSIAANTGKNDLDFCLFDSNGKGGTGNAGSGSGGGSGGGDGDGCVGATTATGSGAPSNTAGAGSDDPSSMYTWLPDVIQDYSPDQTTAYSSTTTSTTPAIASTSGSTPFLNPDSSATAFSTLTGEDVLMNDSTSFPPLSHYVSSDGTISLSPSGCASTSSSSSQQPSPAGAFMNYKDFRLDHDYYHRNQSNHHHHHHPHSHSDTAVFSGDLIHSTGIANIDNYNDPFALDSTSTDFNQFMAGWNFDIENALDAAFITQAPPVPMSSAPTAGLDSASSNAMSVDPNGQVNNSSMPSLPSNTKHASASPLSSTSTSTIAAATRKSRVTKRPPGNNAISSARKRISTPSESPSSTLSHSPSTNPNELSATAAATATSSSSANVTSSVASSAADKRRRNTLAARRCRQRQLDKMAALESALEEALKDNHELKVIVAKQQGEIDVLRSLIPGGGGGQKEQEK